MDYNCDFYSTVLVITFSALHILNILYCTVNSFQILDMNADKSVTTNGGWMHYGFMVQYTNVPWCDSDLANSPKIHA